MCEVATQLLLLLFGQLWMLDVVPPGYELLAVGHGHWPLFAPVAAVAAAAVVIAVGQLLGLELAGAHGPEPAPEEQERSGARKVTDICANGAPVCMPWWGVLSSSGHNIHQTPRAVMLPSRH